MPEPIPEPDWVGKLSTTRQRYIVALKARISRLEDQVAIATNAYGGSQMLSEITVNAPGTYSDHDAVPLPDGSRLTFKVVGGHEIRMHMMDGLVTLQADSQLVVLPSSGNAARLAVHDGPTWKVIGR